MCSAGSGLLAGIWGAPGPELRSEFPNAVLSSLGVAALGMSHSGDPAARSRLCWDRVFCGVQSTFRRGESWVSSHFPLLCWLRRGVPC